MNFSKDNLSPKSRPEFSLKKLLHCIAVFCIKKSITKIRGWQKFYDISLDNFGKLINGGGGGCPNKEWWVFKFPEKN